MVSRVQDRGRQPASIWNGVSLWRTEWTPGRALLRARSCVFWPLPWCCEFTGCMMFAPSTAYRELASPQPLTECPAHIHNPPTQCRSPWPGLSAARPRRLFLWESRSAWRCCSSKHTILSDLKLCLAHTTHPCRWAGVFGPPCSRPGFRLRKCPHLETPCYGDSARRIVNRHWLLCDFPGMYYGCFLGSCLISNHTEKCDFPVCLEGKMI